MSQGDLARQAGTTRAWLARFEAGRADLTLTMLRTLSHALGAVCTIQFQPMTIVHQLDEVPQFAGECEEDAFRSTHELSEQLFAQAAWAPDEALPPPGT